jgi:hypothetical protein
LGIVIPSATLSNCGNTLKPFIPSLFRKEWMAEKELWYGKNEKDETMGNPQPSPNPIKLVWMQFRD